LSVTTEKVPGIDAKQYVSFQHGLNSQFQIETEIFACAHHKNIYKNMQC